MGQFEREKEPDHEPLWSRRNYAHFGHRKVILPRVKSRSGHLSSSLSYYPRQRTQLSQKHALFGGWDRSGLCVGCGSAQAQSKPIDSSREAAHAKRCEPHTGRGRRAKEPGAKSGLTSRGGLTVRRGRARVILLVRRRLRRAGIGISLVVVSVLLMLRGRAVPLGVLVCHGLRCGDAAMEEGTRGGSKRAGAGTQGCRSGEEELWRGSESERRGVQKACSDGRRMGKMLEEDVCLVKGEAARV